MEFLKKISAAFFGLIFYPLKSLFCNLIILIFSEIAVTIAMLVIFVKKIIETISDPNSTGKDYGLLFAVGTTWFFFLIPLQVVLLPVIIIITGLADLFITAYYGAKEGYQKGFSTVLNRLLYEFAYFSFFSKKLYSSIVENNLREAGLIPQEIEEEVEPEAEDEHLYLNDEGYNNVVNLLYQQALNEQQNAAKKTYPEVIELLEKNGESNREFIPLSQEEISLAKNFNILTTILEKYQELNETLIELDEALNKREKAVDDLELMCSLIYMPINKPALLVTQYLNDQNKWSSIPGRSKIIDKPSFVNWVLNNRTHPTTKEPLDQPRRIKIDNIERQTRYCLVNYQNKNDALELIDATETIREILDPPLTFDRAIGHISGYLMSFFQYQSPEPPSQETMHKLSS
ncbi:MAG: hypothetical protein H0T84_10335 [Tatlockia sp.]|nr:hypothetical protein [Tatlockia sp.]